MKVIEREWLYLKDAVRSTESALKLGSEGDETKIVIEMN